MSKSVIAPSPPQSVTRNVPLCAVEGETGFPPMRIAPAPPRVMAASEIGDSSLPRSLLSMSVVPAVELDMTRLSSATGAVPPQFAASLHEMPSPPPVQCTVTATAASGTHAAKVATANFAFGRIADLIMFISFAPFA